SGGALDIRRVSDVDPFGAASGAELGGRRIEPILVEVPKRDLSAFGDEPSRDCESDAGSAAGDDRRRAVEAFAHSHPLRPPWNFADSALWKQRRSSVNRGRHLPFRS